MGPFLDAILAFPTVCFTILLGVTLTYWLFVILGAAGVDLLDGNAVAGAKAASGALAGGAKAVGGVLGGGKAAGGVLHGGSHGAHGAHGHHPHDGPEADSGLFAALGFSGIPVTVSASFVIFASWTLSLLGRNPAHAVLGSLLPGALINGGVGLVSLVLGTLVASLAVRPLRPVFVARHAPGREALMGRLCTISSGNVTQSFGQATIEDGGAGLILNVFCDKANPLKRGDRALILGYDAARDVYEVEPVDWLLPEETVQLQDPRRAAELARARSRVH
jgi:hypothetical protein